jgi:hypothetical protein
MRKLLAWPIAQVLYWLGHWTSIIMEKLPDANEVEPGWLFRVLFATYQSLMLRSFRLNEWAGLGMWSHPDAETESPSQSGVQGE